MKPLRNSTLFLIAILLLGCATSSPIQPYSHSNSTFGNPTSINPNDFKKEEIYMIYHKGATGFVSVQSIREAAEERISNFANRQGKSFVVLGEQISQPPYILGNFPRIEIVFALIEKEQTSVSSETKDKYAKLKELKELLDSGVLTQEEFDTEKQKILDQ